ncbi:hypothetical protein Tco_0645855 [Tanacetum coccineum]
MVTSMGIRHAKPYTLRGGPSMKLEQRSDSQTHVLHLHQALRTKIEIVVIQGLAIQQSLKELFDLIEAWSCPYLPNQCGREITPPPGFSAVPITTTMFAATTPENTPMAYRASTLANPNPVIILTFIEANYEALESLLRDRHRQMHNNDLRTELEIRRRGERKVGFEGALSRAESRVERNTEGGRPLEETPRGNGGQSVNLTLLLAAHLGRGENG